MKFSYALLQQLIEEKLPPPNELADEISLHSFECEGVEGTGEDAVLDLDILPNRASDASGHLGVARDISALLGLTLRDPDVYSLEFATDSSAVQIQTEKCDRYSGVLMEGVEVKESPPWLVKSLQLLGLNSINNIVDSTNYMMLLSGQPLHAFDYDKIAGDKTIIVRDASGGEQVQTLDGGTYTLDSSMCVIADAEQVLGIAGIKGGMASGIDENTKRIFIEAAHFNPLAIRRTARALKLATDASWRFERDVPLCMTPLALGQVVACIQGVAGGEVKGKGVDVAVASYDAPVIHVSVEEIAKTVGVNIKSETCVTFLERLGCEVKVQAGVLEVQTPAFRHDLNIPEDIIEEIARLYGYDAIQEIMPQDVVVSSHQDATTQVYRKVIGEMVERGFFEVHNVVFASKEDIAQQTKYLEDKVWRVENPIDESTPFLRVSLLPSLYRTALDNARYRSSVKHFELGHTWGSDPSPSPYVLGVMLTRHIVRADEAESVKNELLGEMYEALYGVALRLGLSVGDIQKASHFSDDVFYRVSEMQARTYISLGYEIRIDTLLDIALDRGSVMYSPPSKYPPVKRDISLFVDRATTAPQVIEAMNKVFAPHSEQYAVRVEMFDEYDDAKSKEKSLAFHLEFQASDRTLRAEEVDSCLQELYEYIAQHTSWKLR